MSASMRRVFSAPKPRLERVNAIRNQSFPVPEPVADEVGEDDPFRIDGGERTEENVEQILQRLNLSRPDMLGIRPSEWEAVMKPERPASGPLTIHLEQEPVAVAEPCRRNSIDNSQVASSISESRVQEGQQHSYAVGSSLAVAVAAPTYEQTESEDRSRVKYATPAPLELTNSVDHGISLPVESTSWQASDESSDSLRSLRSRGSSTVSVGSSTSMGDEPISSIVPWESWQKLEKLGQGSFGQVYKAMSCLGEFFAVKEISLGPLTNGEAANQLQQEILFLQGCRHENIVQYLGTERTQNELYIFLELATEGSVVSLYRNYILFDQQIRSYTRQILQGLKYLHDMNVVHRDIKCANILVQPNGKVKLADFGMAKKLEILDSMRSAKGSAYWMAPEVIDPRRNAGLPSDIWSLGCTVLEMACGHPPFEGLSLVTVMWKVGHGEIPQIPDHLHPEAQDFIRQCLQVEPANRPTAEKLLEHPFVACTRTPSGGPTRTSSAELIPPTRTSSGELTAPSTPSRTSDAQTPSSNSVRLGRSVRTRPSMFSRAAVGD